MKLSVLALVILLVLTTSMVSADDDPQTPWPVVERCVDQIGPAPEGWSYSGTLLMSGYAGIHAKRAEWATPHVAAFDSTDQVGRPLYEGGQLSPDATWYAVPVGETYMEVSYNIYYSTRGLRLYSMVDDTVLNFALADYVDLPGYSGSFTPAWIYLAVDWIDNESLIMGSLLFRPFDGEVEIAQFLVFESTFFGLTIAPDWTRAFGYARAADRVMGIFDPAVADDLIAPLDAEAVAWRRDSAGFIAEPVNQTQDELSLYDRDGNFIERLYVADEWRLDISRPVAGRNELGWSPTNRYFAFVHDPASPAPNELVLLDMTNRIAINTCLPSFRPTVWSPDGTQIAFLLPAPEDLQVVILDLDTWTAYTVARHSGLSGALEPDMLAWRADPIPQDNH